MRTQPKIILKIQRDVVGEVQRCESGPEILKNQRGFIGDVRRCKGIWPRNAKATHAIHGTVCINLFYGFHISIGVVHITHSKKYY